jgi:queuine tRNA-ribosyltransferase
VKASEKLGVDIVVALGDIPYGRALGSKRVIKAEDRTIAWLQSHTALRGNGDIQSQDGSTAKLFASMLPLPCSKQEALVDCIAGELSANVSGLAIYSSDTMLDFPQSLSHLPRLDFSAPESPHEILQHIRQGMDIMTVPFIGAATDAGIALDFTFLTTNDSLANGHTDEPATLGVDMWNPAHATDVSPLREGCTCYACTNHHRAYVQHLLAAKEMLGWVLLQIHNHHVVDLFFAGVRKSISQDSFEQDIAAFEKAYENRLPEKTGQGPR